MMNQQIAKYIIYAGMVITVAGLILFFFGSTFKWIGRLPGDIRIEGKNSRFYFPVVTMIIISVVLTIIINLFRRWF